MERYEEKLGAGTICRDLLVESGLVMRAVGDTMILAPPFVLSHAEADELIDKARMCLDLTHKALTA
jgi:putrescine aminotransferase